MRETIRYPLTGSDICDQGGRTRNWGIMISAVSAGLGTISYAFPYEETELLGKALGFFSIMVLIYTIWDNESRKRIRNQEFEERSSRRRSEE